MLKYLRIGFFFALQFIHGYFFVVLPNVLFRRQFSLAHRYRTLRRTIRHLYKALRIQLLISHPEVPLQQGPFFIVCNHHSTLDPFLIIHLFPHPIRFLGKKEVRKLFVFGDATASIDTLYIDRKNIRSQIQVLETMKKSLIARDSSWLVFPEGTRNRQNSQPLLPFKPGAFKQAIEAKATILPMVTYGFFRPLNPKLNWKSYPVQVDFLPVITPDMYEGMTTVTLAEKVQASMQAISDKMALIDQDLTRTQK
jgi:1-acyl-sn-glycerol-3-phosphate acyltransferase